MTKSIQSCDQNVLEFSSIWNDSSSALSTHQMWQAGLTDSLLQVLAKQHIHLPNMSDATWAWSVAHSRCQQSCCPPPFLFKLIRCHKQTWSVTARGRWQQSSIPWTHDRCQQSSAVSSNSSSVDWSATCHKCQQSSVRSFFPPQKSKNNKKERKKKKLKIKIFK